MGEISIMEELIKITGNVRLVLCDQYGSVKQNLHVPNLVTTAGKTFIASRMTDTSNAVMGFMWVGTSTTAATVSDTDLITPIAGGRLALTSSTPTANVIAYAATFNAGVATGTITEAGIFNANSAGTMLCRTVFAAVTKGASDILTINWNVTVS